MIVRDYMSEVVVHANLRDHLRQTFFRMQERGIRHMPVLDGEERLVGIVSDRDLRRPDWVDEGENIAHYYLLDNSVEVAEAMTPEPFTAHPDDSLSSAVDVLLEHGFGALPVVDDDRKVVGMLSAVDLLRALRDTL